MNNYLKPSLYENPDHFIPHGIKIPNDLQNLLLNLENLAASLKNENHECYTMITWT